MTRILIIFVGLLGFHAYAKAAYPEKVCPVVEVENPQELCTEVQSRTWDFQSNDVAPNAITYVKEDNLSEAKQRLLLFVREYFDCPDCHFITKQEYDQVAAFNTNLIHPNPNLPAPAFQPVQYSSQPDHSEEQIWHSYGLLGEHQVIIGRIETVKQPLSWYNNNPNAKIFFIPNTDALRYLQMPPYSTRITSLDRSGRCENGEQLKAYSSPSQGENLFYCSPLNDPGLIDGASALDTLKEGCAYGCNPVNLATGAKLDYAVDYRNYSPYPIAWERWYHSPSGGWTFGHNRRLKHYPSGNGSESIVLWRPDGTKIRFSKSAGNPNWSSTKLSVLGMLAGNPSSSERRFSYVNLQDETEHYNAQGQLTALVSPTGQSLSYTYNANDELIRIDDDFGRHLTLAYSGAGKLRHLASVSDGNKTIAYQFTFQSPNSANLWAGRNVLTKVTYPDGKSVEYLYDEQQQVPRGLLTGIVGEDGERYATYLYDPDHRVMQTQHGDGQDTTQYAITPGQDAFVGWEGGSSLFPLNNPQANGISKTSGSSAACPSCGGTQAASVTYDSSGTGAISSMMSFEGVKTDRQNDLRGRPSSVTTAADTALASITLYSWHENTRLPASVYEPVWTNGTFENRMTTYAYDSKNQLETKTIGSPFSGGNRVWTWTYNANGQPLTATDPVSGTTTYAYQAVSGNLASVTNALGQATLYSDYTPQGKPGKTTDPNGLQTVFTYDARDRITEVKTGTPGGHWETMTVAYTAYGSVRQITRPDGTWVKYTYDSARRVTAVEDPRGKMVLTLDNNGDVVKQEVFDLNNALVLKSISAYDSYRRLQSQIDANNKATSFLYLDSSDQLVWQTDPDQPNPNQPGTQFVSYQYDAAGQPAATNSGHAGQGRTTQTQFTKTGQLEAALDGNYTKTSFSYNLFGESVAEQSPDAGLKQWERNAAGQVERFTDGRGAQHTYTYDILGRATQIQFAGAFLTPAAADETQTFVYDTCSNGVGRLCQFTDHSGTTSYSYDVWGRTTQKVFVPANTPGVSLVTAYDYNQQGQLVSIHYPSGKRMDYTYDRGAVKTVEYDFHPVLGNAQYQSGTGAIKGWQWGSFAGQVVFSYDLNGRLSRIQDVDDRQYQRNHKGWITAITDPVNPDANQAYTYNQTGFLKQAVLAARPDPIDFAVDENDNIYSKMVSPAWEDELFSDYFTNYGINNRPFVIYDGLPEYTPIFDGAGNMTDDGESLTLVYDAKGRVRSSERRGSEATYAYNALGQRMRKSDTTLSTGHRFYAYDEAGRVLGEYDGTGKALEEYVYLDGHRPVAVARNLGLTQLPVVYPILTDHLGTPRKILNPSGTLVWSWDAKDPYGYQAPNELESGTVFTFDLRFPGQRYDKQTGLFHNGFRDYDPKFGRYVQADPIGLEGGWNHYAYAGANPINNYDFTGLKINTFGNKDVEASIAYLKANSSIAAKILSEVESASISVNIVAGEGFKNQFNPNNDVVTWDPRRAMYCKVKNRMVSPALALFHEIYHAHQKAYNPSILERTYEKDSRIAQRYTNPAEYNAVVVEASVAWQLGEGARSSHNGNYRKNPFIPVGVSSPVPIDGKLQISKTQYRYQPKAGPNEEW